jgi:hypothetical protein
LRKSELGWAWFNAERGIKPGSDHQLCGEAVAPPPQAAAVQQEYQCINNSSRNGAPAIPQGCSSTSSSVRAATSTLPARGVFSWCRTVCCGGSPVFNASGSSETNLNRHNTAPLDSISGGAYRVPRIYHGKQRGISTLVRGCSRIGTVL